MPLGIGCEILPAEEAHLPALADLAGVIWRTCYPDIISPEQIEFMLEPMDDFIMAKNLQPVGLE